MPFHNVTLSVGTDAEVWGRVQPEFLSVTMDWWGPRHDGWGNASVLNADFQRLEPYASELKPFFWRIGGSQADSIIYQVRGDEEHCRPNRCLTMGRWREILDFASRVGCRIVFCLNYLMHTEVDGERDRQDWNSSNTKEFLTYTSKLVDRELFYGFELGNELTHNGKAKNTTRMKLALKELKSILRSIWPDDPPKVLGPASTGGTTEHLVKDLAPELDVITYHKYFGSGMSNSLEKKAKKPSFFVEPTTFQQRVSGIREFSNASIWIGEGAMAYNSGRANVTDSFFSSLWTANLLGALSKTPHEVYCRQTLTGGFYELIRHKDLQPNPDFWLARIWKALVGDIAIGPLLSPNRPSHYKDRSVNWGCCEGSTKDTLLAHAFCARPSSSGEVVLVVINVSSKETFSLSLPMGKKRSVYKLVATKDNGKAGAMGARNVFLNGELQILGPNASFPSLRPMQSTRDDLLLIDPYSIAFVVIHNHSIFSCQNSNDEGDGAAEFSTPIIETNNSLTRATGKPVLNSVDGMFLDTTTLLQGISLVSFLVLLLIRRYLLSSQYH